MTFAQGARLADIVQDALGDLGEDGKEAPLINDLFPKSMVDTHYSKSVKGKVRAEALQRLLINLLQIFSIRKPLLLIFNDCAR
jgi:hypothetical protein